MTVSRSIRTTAGLLALALTTASCGVLPDDHALQGALGRSLRRATDSVGSISRAFDAGGRDLNALAAKVAAAPEAAGREVARLRGAGTGLVDRTTRRLTGIWPRTQRALQESGEEGIRRLASLRAAPARVGVRIERNLADLRGALARSPSALRLDVTPMAEPEDPDRTVEVVTTARRPTWLERILDRMAF